MLTQTCQRVWARPAAQVIHRRAFLVAPPRRRPIKPSEYIYQGDIGAKDKDKLLHYAGQARQRTAPMHWTADDACINPLGQIYCEEDYYAVLDHRFRVRGTRGLRVVDASALPRIPGFFIVSAVYMLSEKAADELLRDASAEV